MDLKNITRCIICSSESFSEHIQCRDHFVSQESFSISSCKDCGFCFTNPRPDIDGSAAYYDSSAYVSHSKTSRGLINRLFHLARTFTIRDKKRLLKKYTAGNQLLDYGCGTGEFLYAMKNSGWDGIGIEPNNSAREHAIKSYSLKVHTEDDLNAIPNASLDAISLWHVLEHVYPIEERLAEFYQKLKPGGTLFVALPNMRSYDARKYDRYWAAYDVPRHIYHFSPESAIRLMGNFGFDHVASKPMLLDSFYISMLSEKYKSGSPKNIRAFFFGLWSNLNAFFGKGNYSSLIYIFKKSK